MIADQVIGIGQRGTTNTITFQNIITVEPGRIHVSLSGEPGAIWELQGSPDLQLWEKISYITNTTGTVDTPTACLLSPPAGFIGRFCLKGKGAVF